MQSTSILALRESPRVAIATLHAENAALRRELATVRADLTAELATVKAELVTIRKEVGHLPASDPALTILNARGEPFQLPLRGMLGIVSRGGNPPKAATAETQQPPKGGNGRKAATPARQPEFPIIDYGPWPGGGYKANRWAGGRVLAAGLRGSRVGVASQLAIHADDAGEARPSVGTLSGLTGFCARTVRTCLRDLEAAGVIECIDRRGGRHRAGRYVFTDAKGGNRPGPGQAATDDRKAATPAAEDQKTSEAQARGRAKGHTTRRGKPSRGRARLDAKASSKNQRAAEPKPPDPDARNEFVQAQADEDAAWLNRHRELGFEFDPLKDGPTVREEVLKGDPDFDPARG